LLGAGLAALAYSFASPVLAAMPRMKGVRELSFRNLHTDEKLSVAYWRNGAYDRRALARINHILRDFRSGDVHNINVSLLDFLHDLNAKLRRDSEIEIISGYRSPKTNSVLSRASDGVAKKSFHMKGMAIDINMPGVSLSKLRGAAVSMGRGGVGYYPSSGFVHVDVGPARQW
jgi:uncharacterized protein YcbK (DUF882 family)